METLERILAEHPFFQGLATNYLQLMVGCASNVRFNAGDYLFHEGEDAQKFYLLREGKVVLELPVTKHEPVSIQRLNEGDVLGWSWLIPPYQWHFDARATTSVRALELDGACLRDKCEADHDLGYEVMKRFTPLIAQRLQASRRNLLEIYHAYNELVEGRP
jgi:CRP-like cAMP-binding protein